MNIIDSKPLLFVEGKAERIFIPLMLGADKAKLEIVDVEGNTNFKDKIKQLKARSGFEKIPAIGIIRDAEVNLKNKSNIAPVSPVESAWDSVKGWLIDLKLPYPSKPGIFTKKEVSPAVGVYLLPDNLSAGMLEDLAFDSIDENIKRCIEDFYECIKRSRPNDPEGFNLAKAKFRTFLATRAGIVKACNLHKALEEDSTILDLNHNCFSDLRNFLNELIKFTQPIKTTNL